LPWLLAGGGVFLVAVAALVLVLVLKRTPNGKGPAGSAGESSASGLAGYIGVAQLAVSGDGTKLATYKDGAIKIWDLSSGNELTTLADAHRSASLALSRDGQLLASSSQEDLRVWDLKTGQIKVKVATGRNGIAGLSADNKSAYCFMVNLGITVVDITSGAITRLAENKQFPTAGAFSPVAALGAVSISAVDITAVKASPDTVEMYDLKTGDVIVTLKPFAPPKTTFAMAFSGDGDFLACGARDQICVLQNSTRNVVAILDARGREPLAKLQVAPQGKFVASFDKGAVTFWNVQTKTSRSIGFSGCQDIAFRPDGQLLLSCSGAPIRVLDPATGTEGSLPK
jgi:WD40 repeat protein